MAHELNYCLMQHDLINNGYIITVVNNALTSCILDIGLERLVFHELLLLRFTLMSSVLRQNKVYLSWLHKNIHNLWICQYDMFCHKIYGLVQNCSISSADALKSD